MKLAPGTVLAARYRLTHPLGEGGMGEVWAATHTVTGRPVAIKRLRLSLIGERDTSARSRFILEAQAACAVEHPSVVEILDFVEHPDEAPVIVMELLEGETLAEKIVREHALSVAETVRLLLPVVSAVGTAHALGIVHRDLKPSNIFLSPASDHGITVKVLDFGIAKWMAAQPSDAPLRTQTGSTLGTPSYMAPEQAVGERSIDHRADIWSIGVILYECMSGVRPVEGESAAQIMVRLLSTGIMPIERLAPTVPRELAELIGRMLSREAARRPHDLGEVAAVLAASIGVPAPEFGKPRSEIISNTLSVAINAHASTQPVALNADASHAADSVPKDGRALESGDPTKQRSFRSRRLFFAIGATAGVAVLAAAILSLDRRPAPDAANPALAAGQLPSTPRPPLPASPTRAPVPTTAPLAQIPGDAAPASRDSVGQPMDRAAGQAPPRSVAVRGPSESTTAATATADATSGLPPGAACERSRDCASRMCVAFACD